MRNGIHKPWDARGPRLLNEPGTTEREGITWMGREYGKRVMRLSVERGTSSQSHLRKLICHTWDCRLWVDVIVTSVRQDGAETAFLSKMCKNEKYRLKEKKEQSRRTRRYFISHVWFGLFMRASMTEKKMCCLKWEKFLNSKKDFDALWIYIDPERWSAAGSQAVVQQNCGDVYCRRWDHLGQRGAIEIKTIEDLGLRPDISLIWTQVEVSYFYCNRKVLLVASGERCTSVQKGMSLECNFIDHLYYDMYYIEVGNLERKLFNEDDSYESRARTKQVFQLGCYNTKFRALSESEIITRIRQGTQGVKRGRGTVLSPQQTLPTGIFLLPIEQVWNRAGW